MRPFRTVPRMTGMKSFWFSSIIVALGGHLRGPPNARARPEHGAAFEDLQWWKGPGGSRQAPTKLEQAPHAGRDHVPTLGRIAARRVPRGVRLLVLEVARPAASAAQSLGRSGSGGGR